MDDDVLNRDWSGVSTTEVETLLVSWAAREASVRARFLATLAVWYRRRGWEAWECVSPAQWLSWKCGLGSVAAHEHLRVALALETLPAITAAMGEGKLSWTKVREVTRVATPESEEKWLTIALDGTAAHVEKVVRAFRRITPAQVEHQHADRRMWSTVADDGSVILSVKLPAEVGDGIMEAVRKATTPERGVPYAASLADTFVRLVTSDATVTPEVSIHVDAPALLGEEGVCATASGVPIAPEIARLALCEGTVQLFMHDGEEVKAVSERRRFASPAQRRAAQANAKACDVNGCDNRGRLHAHHIVHDAHGGKTKGKNLAYPCTSHHRLIHLHDLQLERLPNGKYELLWPNGQPVGRTIDPIAVREPDPTGTPVPNWAGEHLDLDLTLWLLSNFSGVSGGKLAEAA